MPVPHNHIILDSNKGKEGKENNFKFAALLFIISIWAFLSAPYEV